MEEKELFKIEEEIAEKLKDAVKDVYSREAYKIIEAEVKNKKYLSNDWQIGYAVQRIQEKIMENHKKRHTIKEKVDLVQIM